jgi:hypothetical protein
MRRLVLRSSARKPSNPGREIKLGTPQIGDLADALSLDEAKPQDALGVLRSVGLAHSVGQDVPQVPNFVVT